MSVIRVSVQLTSVASHATHVAVRAVLTTAAVVAGVVAALAAVPAAFMMADHVTVVRWSNELLNFISN